MRNQVDLFYNIIHYYLYSKDIVVTPLHYSDSSCTFSYYQNRPIPPLSEIKHVIESITSVQQLHPNGSIENIRADLKPQLINGVFKYTPFRQICPYNKESLMDILNSTSCNKKSRTLKYTLTS